MLPKHALYRLSYTLISRKRRDSNPQALAEPRISSPLESPISCASIAEAAGLEPTRRVTPTQLISNQRPYQLGLCFQKLAEMAGLEPACRSFAPTTLLSKEGQYQLWDTSISWDRRELNPRRAGLRPTALPTELQPHKENSTAQRTRTPTNCFGDSHATITSVRLKLEHPDGFEPPVGGLQPHALPGLAKGAF